MVDVYGKCGGKKIYNRPMDPMGNT